MTPRPTCVHCGEPYATRRTEEQVIEHPAGTKEPPYTGNLRVTRVERYKRATAFQRETGFDHLPSPTELKSIDHVNVVRRTLWDGESYWGGYDPFCTLRCALDYARKAYRQTQLRRVS